MGNNPSSSSENGNQAATAAAAGGGEQHDHHDSVVSFGEFVWAESLLDEIQEMSDATFLTEIFALLLKAAGDDKNKKNLTGLSLDEKGVPTKEEFSAQDVSKIIKENSSILQSDMFAKALGSTLSVEDVLAELQERTRSASLSINGGKPKKPFTLQHFGIKHDPPRMVYSIGKDRQNKRITVTFCSDHMGVFDAAWNAPQKAVALPKPLQSLEPTGFIHLHSGLYQYLFDKEKNGENKSSERGSSSTGSSVYAEILEHLNQLVEVYPNFKIYLTGHGVGGALATMASFFLANEGHLPKPISVITFGSPRLGNYAFLQGTQKMESEGLLRLCRVVKEGDYLPTTPVVHYSHVGFQLRLHNNESKNAGVILVAEPEVTYPKLKDPWSSRFQRAWNNAVVNTSGVALTHDAYRKGIVESQTALLEMNLNHLYADEELTGFKVADHEHSVNGGSADRAVEVEGT